MVEILYFLIYLGIKPINMPKLNWISDEDLNNNVSHLLNKAEQAKKKVQKNFNQNVIDPFSALFVMWLKMESTRQSQKTLQNHIGEFHQNILGAVNGWTNLKTGNVVDLVSEERQVIAEIKNKYNTISGGKLADLYKTLEGLVMPKTNIYKNYTAYYVAIIPKKKVRYNKIFTPSDKEKGEKCADNPNIREIDGASFYDLATGEENALSNLYNVLPEVIEELTRKEFNPTDFKYLRKYFDDAFQTA